MYLWLQTRIVKEDQCGINRRRAQSDSEQSCGDSRVSTHSYTTYTALQPLVSARKFRCFVTPLQQN